jgi:hypothetical protein
VFWHCSNVTRWHVLHLTLITLKMSPRLILVNFRDGMNFVAVFTPGAAANTCSTRAGILHLL